MLNRLFSLSLAVVLFSLYFLLIYQHPANAQTLEDTLGKAKEDIEKAQQSGVPLGTVSILSNSSHTDSAGILHVVGEVYNDMAPDTAKDVQVVATFYDSNAKVVGTSSAFTNLRNIASGENAPFDLSLPAYPLKRLIITTLKLIGKRDKLEVNDPINVTSINY